MVPPLPEGWSNRRYRRWLGREFGWPSLHITDKDAPSCPSRRSRAYEWQVILTQVHAYLGGDNEPDSLDLEWAVRAIAPDQNQQMGKALAHEYRLRYGGDGNDLQRIGLRQRPLVLAAAGRPEIYGPNFRSSWERRLSVALTRLGIRWEYESDQFYYRDWRGAQRRYTPDFRLLDFTDTFVEVKGPAGPDAADTDKMSKVVTAYPNLTLLLWDADRVEYIEEVTDPLVVVGLLRTTRLAA